MFFAVGKNAVLEALRAGAAISHVVIAKDARRDEKINEVISLAKRRGVSWSFEDAREMAKMFPGLPDKKAQVVAVREAGFEYADLDDILQKKAEGAGLVVALDHIEDPHNLGAILRTCAATGADAVVIPSRRSCEVTHTVAAASSGGVERVPIAKVANLTQCLERMQKAGYWVVGTDERAEKECWSYDFSGPTVLVFGNEGGGLSRLASETCDELIRIPTADDFPSLNVSVAAGIVLYEALRRRRGGARKK